MITKIIAERGGVCRVHLTADFARNLPARFFFLAMYPDKKEALHAAEHIADLREYGKVMYRGYGSPSEEALNKIREQLDLQSA